MEAADQEQLEAWLSHPDRTDLKGEDPAIYCAVPCLSIYWAHEGKNRVQFLRDRGLTHVPANLTLYSYPDPDRIELFPTRLLGRDEVWAVLDRRWVQPILLPLLGVRVLNEYGVAAASHWPENWPDADAVAEKMYQGVDPNGARPFNCVDLYPLEARRREEARGYEMVDASIHEVEGFRFKPGALAAFAATCLLLVLVGALLRSATGSAVALVGVSALLTLVGTLTCPILRAARRHLEFSYQGRADCQDLSLESPRER